jgi:hypothetical protein
MESMEAAIASRTAELVTEGHAEVSARRIAELEAALKTTQQLAEQAIIDAIAVLDRAGLWYDTKSVRCALHEVGTTLSQSSRSALQARDSRLRQAGAAEDLYANRHQGPSRIMQSRAHCREYARRLDQNAMTSIEGTRFVAMFQQLNNACATALETFA